MSSEYPHFERALEEADFLRDRLFNLQEQLLDGIDPETHLDYLHTMYALIDKEHSIYTRLHLMDTPEARETILSLDAYKVVQLLDTSDVNIHNVYPIVKRELIELIKNVSEEDWTPEDFDIDPFYDDI